MTTTISREAELRTVLATKTAEMNEGIAKGVKVDGANVTVSAEDRDKLVKLRDEINEIKTLIGVEVLGIEIKEFLETPERQSLALGASGATIGKDKQQLREIKTLGQMFVESTEFKEHKPNGDSSPFEVVGVQDIASFGQYGVKDVWSGSTGGTPVGPRPFGTIQFDPMVPRQQRAARVRDLFPAVGTTASLIDYFRVLGYVGGDATGNKANVVPEPTETAGVVTFNLKPQTKLAFSSQQAPVRTIAHWEAAHRNVLDDQPQLRGTIDNELLYGLRLKEDQQILSGSGVNDELLGILNTPSIQTYTQANAAGAATEQMSDALRRAATKVAIANFQSTGYVLHPNNWEDVELQKASGDGQYMLVTNIAIGAQTQVWRQPVVETVAIPENTFLTGAFGLGAQLYDRQLANVRTAEQHADFFTRNAVVILVEERLALAVKRPESFVKGTFFVA